jgi:hypothetical protein
MGVILDAVKQRDAILVDNNIRDGLFHAPDMIPARGRPFPRRDAVPAGDEKGFLHGISDEPHGPQDHAAGARRLCLHVRILACSRE